MEIFNKKYLKDWLYFAGLVLCVLAGAFIECM